MREWIYSLSDQAVDRNEKATGDWSFARDRARGLPVTAEQSISCSYSWRNATMGAAAKWLVFAKQPTRFGAACASATASF